jgi:hypothetical protein
VGWIDLGSGPMTRFCEHASVPSGSIKGRTFLEELSNDSAFEITDLQK